MHKHREECYVKTEADVGMMYLQSQGTSKIAGHHQTLERGSEGFCSLFSLRERKALPTPWFGISSLQNCEVINNCYFRLLILWWYYSTPKETYIGPYAILAKVFYHTGKSIYLLHKSQEFAQGEVYKFLVFLHPKIHLRISLYTWPWKLVWGRSY